MTTAAETQAPVEPAGATPGGRPAPGTVVIETRGLTKQYGTLTAVDHLDLQVRAGEIFGLLGPNGAGKTTTVLMLLGLSEPTSGTARVLGLDPARKPLTVKRHVGYLPDNVGFYGNLTGRQNLAYTARLNGIAEAEIAARVDAALAQVRLTDAADRHAEHYSRGMRQRLGIADALIKDPEILVLDEPTIAIDPQGVVELLALIRRLVEERGLAILLSSHLLEQVQSICDRVGIFLGGRMVAHGTVEELASRSRGVASVFEVGVEGLDPGGASADALLRGVPGVTEVAPDPAGIGRWVVTARGDVRADVVRAVLDAGGLVVHLAMRTEQLEAVYRRYVETHPDRRRRDGDDGTG